MFKLLPMLLALILTLTACIPPAPETCPCEHDRTQCSGPVDIGGVAPSDYPGC